ncbi:sulfotransferase family 2 domain-containing protein, partial [Fulvivirga lutimaris]|uniref:sulfotransferase family 2 domain-containing protein n=1 Tax=Fulvivirga lutimaris TaxID=1819566 RepID=UPI00162429BC
VKYTTFPQFVRALENSRERMNIMKIPHFVPQVKFLKTINSRLEMDFIGRFEEINADFKIVKEALGVNVDLPHKNKSDHKDYLEYYDPELFKIVNEVYK